MRKIAAAAFKTNCLAVMDEVQAKHETVVITKHGKPVAKLVPVNTETEEIYNFLAGQGTSQETSFHPQFGENNETGSIGGTSVISRSILAPEPPIKPVDREGRERWLSSCPGSFRRSNCLCRRFSPR
jgi:prevent-host-death family protein